MSFGGICIEDCKRYYFDENITLFQGDCLEVLQKLDENSVDLIFADPPYNLSNGGLTCKAGKFVSVNKGNWDKSRGVMGDFNFTVLWLKECRRVLKPNGTIWVSGTHHNIHQVGFALQTLKFHLMNEIVWFKPNASPNLSCRYFTHSHETLIWAKKEKSEKHKFNYPLMRFWDSDLLNKKGKQMRSVWTIPLTPLKEKTAGKHPTQKPIELLKRIITASTDEGAVVLDPFNGSGTTGVVANMLGRKYIGIEKEKEYLDLTLKRLNAQKEQAVCSLESFSVSTP
ncbi:MAG: site-specific DNA-methyltransferase [Candidatus Diapherotrites archaeon]|nr:site-specific DNA-methyltransferase [Candidatus Diapherotrites archaeon]